MTEELQYLLDQLRCERHKNDDVLVVDGLNMFLRCFSAIKNVNSSGYHIGGLMGFLRSLNNLMHQFSPSRIIIAWEGKGSTAYRRSINPDYKAQRAHAGIIHPDIYDTKEQELESMFDQLKRLHDYLGCLPVTPISVQGLEADDVIATLSHLTKTGLIGKVTIVSTDRDFLQLVSPGIEIYSPVKRVMYDYDATAEFLQVLPENYNIVKAVVGDISDNIKGIRGAGIRTLIKMFPKLTSDPGYSLDELLTESEQHGAKKVGAGILEGKEIIKNNYKVMDLHEISLTTSQNITILSKVIKEEIPKLRIGPFEVLLEDDGIDGIASNMEEWLLEFLYLETIK